MKKVFLLSLLLMLIVSIGTFAASRTASVTGDWNNTATWGGESVPGQGDDVTINAGVTVTVNGAYSCNSITLGTGDGIASLTFSNTNPSLTVIGNVSVGTTLNPFKSAGSITFIEGSTLTAGSVSLVTVTKNRSEIIMTEGSTLRTGSLIHNVVTGGGTPSPALWTPGTGTVELLAANTLPASVFTTFNNLTIKGATTFAADIALTGNWTNDLSTVPSNFTVTFNGITSQSIGGTSPTTFYNLTINNSGSGVTLNIDETVNGTLTLTNGLLILGSSNLLLGGTAIISGAPSASNMVVATGSGELRKTFTGIGSFTFPVGDNTGTAEYSPVTLNFTAGTFTSAYAGVNLVNAKHPDNGSTDHYIKRYWTVTSSGISSISCDVTFTYIDPADINGTEANLYCGSWSGSAWTLLLVANTTLNQLSGTVTSFSVFTGGEQSALPVELSSFSASVTKTGVLLNWKTDTEVNNYGFEILRQAQDDEWEALGFVEGHGNSNSPKEYNFKDSEINSAGIYSYKLKQIDNDGSYEFSKTIEVNFNVPSNFELSQNYPNPFNPSTTISFNLPESGKVTLKIYNIIGKEIKTLVEGYREAGIHTFNFNAEGYPSGMYFYSLSTNGFTETKKMLFMK
jgi:hypothetical protein